MNNTRSFSGDRPPVKKRSMASKLQQIEQQKGGKLMLSPQERYKMILRDKLQDHQEKTMAARSQEKLPSQGKMPTLQNAFKMSARAQEALKQIAMKKAAKQEKELRQMVVIKPRILANGRIDKKGRVLDLSDQVAMRINTKNGKINTMAGWYVGKYKPKSYANGNMINEAIKKHGPYFIKQRQMMMQQQMGQFNQMMTGAGSQFDYSSINSYGGVPDLIDIQGNAQSVNLNSTGGNAGASVTAWGVRSDNIHGTFSNNVWGTASENVWGTTYTDIWGGFGTGAQSLYGSRSVNVWGTGSGKNMLKGITSLFGAIFGFSLTRSARRRSMMRAVRGR